MSPIRRRTALWAAVVALVACCGPVIARKARQSPKLGAFTAPADFIIKGPDGTLYRWTGSATFTPSGSESRRSLSGVGTFTPVGIPPIPKPDPIPVPTPTPIPTPTPTPQPVPPGAINVRTFGAVGNDQTDDTAACQRALQAVQPGGTLYLPSGTYRISGWLKFTHPVAMTVMGDGPTSVIHSVAGGGLMIGTGGEPGGPVQVRQIKLQGNHGATMRSTIQPSGGIQVFGPQNTVVDNVDFQDVTSAVFDAAPTAGTITRNCRINGWARVAFFCEKGAQVTHCTILQNDPNPAAGNTSHAFYIHGTASNVLVTDCEIAGVAKYAAQQYSESPNTITSGVQFRRLNIHDCQNGIVFAHSQQGAGDIINSVIDSCTITNTTGGSAILIKDGDGVTVSNNVIDGCVSYGIGVGGWAPYESNFSLANVDIFGNTVRNCAVGLFGLASNGGTFSNVRFHGNTIAGNKQNLSLQSVLGLSYSPTGPRRARQKAGDL